MTVVCVGSCMRVDDQGRLTIDVPPNSYDCDPLFGEPVYCDPNGQLRGPPRQRVLNTFYSEATPGFIWTPPNGVAAQICHTFSVQVTNPDPCRRMRGVAIWTLRAVTILGENTQIQVSGGGDAAHEYRNDDLDAPRLYFHDFVRNTTVDIPPGGSQTLSMELCTNRTSGGATGTNVTEMRTTMRIMAVSETTT